MCKISDQLKLCTCETNDVEQLKHYWVLSRPGRQFDLIGETFPPTYIGEKLDRINENTILKLLNEGNCFDTEIMHQENDVLELHFDLNLVRQKNLASSYNSNYLIYTFKFQRGIWELNSFDPFGKNTEDILKGQILRPFAAD